MTICQGSPHYVCNPDWDIPHGFFGISGGVSHGHWATLNGGHPNDTPGNIEKNHTIALHALGLSHCKWIPNQKHTVRVVQIPQDIESINEPADALVCKNINNAIGILTADCAPILFYDPVSRVIGAAHAGWRGAISGILENTVGEMCALGAHISRIQATIGPMIQQKSYQVSPIFLETIQEKTSWDISPMIRSFQDQLFFDLPLYVRTRLIPLVSKIQDVQIDTFGGNFFSHRYALSQDRMGSEGFAACSDQCGPHGKWYHGRNMSWISLPPC
jgi:hypothetical protein